jgi:hypothetical protein
VVKEETMAHVGKNMRTAVSREHRAALRTVLIEVLGCEHLQPPGRDDLDIYLFGDGFSLGVYALPPGEALAPEDHLKGAWLELLVDDPDRVHAALAARGVEPFPYADGAHRYYQAPGGPVFRLAKGG